MSLSYAAPERLSQKKFVSKAAAQPAALSTINIGVEDFPSPHSSEDAGHYGSSQRPPRRAGGSVHFNMPTTSKASPRHTVLINKAIPGSKASTGNGNGSARDSSTVLSSTASRGKKLGPGSNLLRVSEAPFRQVCSCSTLNPNFLSFSALLFPVVLSFSGALTRQGDDLHAPCRTPFT